MQQTLLKTFIVGSVLSSAALVGFVLTVKAQNRLFEGTVEQVWEDGFRLKTGDRTLQIDAWDVCGDLTTNFVAVGDRLTVSGEFDEGEFDAFSITNDAGHAVCS